ncbi:GNAT family N-acetyltransferase [bacterium]|nr:GNAT family N-acetyltransferase [bacterium]
MLDTHQTTRDWQAHTGPVAVLPVGSCEQHGAHLPLATDNLEVTFFARLLAEDLNAALLPTVNYGTCLEHSGFRGSVSLRPETLMQIVRDVADEMERQHFRIVVLVNGHGGNFCLGPVVRDFNRADRPVKILLVEAHQFWPFEIAESKDRGPDSHAGEMETSVMLAIHPELVGEDRVDVPLPAGEPRPLSLADLNTFGLGQVAPAGAYGFPSLASKEKGEAIVDAVRKRWLPFVRDRIRRLERQWSYAGAGGILVRPLTEADLPAAMRLKALAGWNQTEAEWRWFLEANAGGCFAAVQNGIVIGTVASIRYGNRLAWVSMMLVEPGRRRMGLGHQLMEAVMANLKDCPCVKLDATPAGHDLYRAFGFTDELALQRLVVASLPPSTAELSSPLLRPLNQVRFKAVAALDRTVFGADRSGIIQSLWQAAPGSAWCLERRGKLQGYCVGRPGANFHHLGPVVAASTADAVALAQAGLRGLAGRSVGLDVPDSQPDFGQWLHRLGFVAERPLTRMVHGRSPVSGEVDHVFAVVGPEFG